MKKYANYIIILIALVTPLLLNTSDMHLHWFNYYSLPQVLLIIAFIFHIDFLIYLFFKYINENHK